MFLRKKIIASSLAEVIIALSIIALCFGIASLVFVRFTTVSTNFQFVKKQTEIQSLLWKKLQNNAALLEYDEVEIEEQQSEEMENSVHFIVRDLKGKTIWEQEVVKND